MRMNLRVVAVGKPRLGYAKAGVEEYAARLKAWGGVNLEYVKATGMAGEGGSLLARSEGCLRVVLDERGEEVTSLELAARLRAWEENGTVKTVAFLVGGADGHAPEVRARGAWVWALGKLTLPHELALVVLVEQLYRARTILSGGPYHRG